MSARALKPLNAKLEFQRRPGRRLAARQQGTDQRHVLAHLGHRVPDVLPVPAAHGGPVTGAEPEAEAAAGQVVDRGGRLRHRRGGAVIDRGHRRGQGDRRGEVGQPGEGRERIAGGDVRAVDRVVAELIGHRGVLAHGGDVAGRGDQHACLHRHRHRPGCGKPGPATSAFRSSPRPSIVLTSVVPGRRNSGGLRPMPTPDGVPVKIRSPGEHRARGGNPGHQLRNGEDHVPGPAVLQHPAVDRAAQPQIVAVRQLVGCHQPRSGRPEAGKRLPQRELRHRAGQLNRPLRQVLARHHARDVGPGLLLRHPFARAARSPRPARPPSPPGRWAARRWRTGPARQLRNLVNTGGTPGASTPDSAACSR